MKLRSKILIILLFVCSSVFAESLATKIGKMEYLIAQSEKSNQAGYYDDAYRLSEEAKKLSSELEALMQRGQKLGKLKYHLAVAKQVQAPKYASELYQQAMTKKNESEALILKEKLEEADPLLDEGIELALEAIEAAKIKFEAQEKQVEVTKVMDFYVVRLIPNRRDCLWRIAEYDFVYGDPLKWEAIYEANSDKIKDPNLIYPGQKLLLPAQMDDIN